MGIVINLPQFSELFLGATQKVMIFLLAFLVALSAIWWPRLQNRDPYLILPAYVIFIPIFSLLASRLARTMQIQSDGVIRNFEFNFLIQNVVVEGAVFAFFLLLAVAAISGFGLKMRKRNETFSIRRAATDWEEMQNLFQMKIAVLPDPDVSIYKFQKVLEYGHCIVGVIKNQILGFLQSIYAGEALYLYDLGVREGSDRSLIGRALVQDMLKRLKPVETEKVFALLPISAGKDIEDIYLSEGFHILTEEEKKQAQIGKIILDEIFRESIPDWQPFKNMMVKFCYDYKLESTTIKQ